MAEEQSEYRKALLERNSAIKARYNDAAQGKEVQQSKAGEGQSNETPEMVKQSAPQPELRPKNEVGREVDRQSFDQRWDNEADKARAAQLQKLAERNERAKRANNAQDGVNLGRDGNTRD